MDNYGAKPGKYPAIVKSYDQDSRTCRIEIPGLTDGGDVFPVAEIEYPIGDKSRSGSNSTEIEIVAGDSVWIEFIGGDVRYPLITGYRNPKAGNSIDWRRFHHANIELTAEGVLRLNAESVEINADSVEINSGTVTINGETTVNGGSLKHNSKEIGDTHTHSAVKAGPDTTGEPV